MANGDLLVSEIRGSWIDEITPNGRLVWSVHLPIAYPSDPQQLGPDLYLVADYTGPGGHRLGHAQHPEGFDLLLADGTTPTHPQTG